jgi:7-cyano-7-deazaguanine synthase
MKIRRPLVLVSGGIDSTTLVYDLMNNGFELSLLTYNYGQVFFDREIFSIRESIPSFLTKKLEVMDISFAYKGLKSPLLNKLDLWITKVTREDMYLPCRNLLFYSFALCYAKQNGNDSIFSGFIDGDKVLERDSASIYLEKISKFAQENEDIPIVNPFIGMSKREIVLLAMQLGVPLEKTYSCQISDSIPCGACPNCSDRNDIFEEIFSQMPEDSM